MFKLYEEHVYFIAVEDDRSMFDWNVALALNIDLPVYKNKLVNEFNAKFEDWNDGIYFEELVDAKRAFEWIEAQYVMRLLTGEEQKYIITAEQKSNAVMDNSVISFEYKI